jgi:hypothetical protein
MFSEEDTMFGKKCKKADTRYRNDVKEAITETATSCYDFAETVNAYNKYAQVIPPAERDCILIAVELHVSLAGSIIANPNISVSVGGVSPGGFPDDRTYTMGYACVPEDYKYDYKYAPLTIFFKQGLKMGKGAQCILNIFGQGAKVWRTDAANGYMMFDYNYLGSSGWTPNQKRAVIGKLYKLDLKTNRLIVESMPEG